MALSADYSAYELQVLQHLQGLHLSQVQTHGIVGAAGSIGHSGPIGPLNPPFGVVGGRTYSGRIYPQGPSYYPPIEPCTLEDCIFDEGPRRLDHWAHFRPDQPVCSSVPELQSTVLGTVVCSDTMRPRNSRGVRIRLSRPIHLPWEKDVQAELVIAPHRLRTLSLLDAVAVVAAADKPLFRHGFRPRMSKRDFRSAIR